VHKVLPGHGHACCIEIPPASTGWSWSSCNRVVDAGALTWNRLPHVHWHRHDLGEIVAADPRREDLVRLMIACGYPRASIVEGASIACSGVCLTVVGIARTTAEPGLPRMPPPRRFG